MSDFGLVWWWLASGLFAVSGGLCGGVFLLFAVFWGWCNIGLLRLYLRWDVSWLVCWAACGFGVS